MPAYGTQGIVYFIGATTGIGSIKVGFSTSPFERLWTLQFSSPLQLEIIACCAGTMAMEQHYHWRYREHLAHGEWFRRHTRMYDDMAEMCRPMANRVGYGVRSARPFYGSDLRTEGLLLCRKLWGDQWTGDPLPSDIDAEIAELEIARANVPIVPEVEIEPDGDYLDHEGLEPPQKLVVAIDDDDI